MSKTEEFRTISLSIPAYHKSGGISDVMVDNSSIDVHIEGEEVVIWANQAGLEYLAMRLLSLAQLETPSGYHFHLSSSYGLLETSNDLVIGRLDINDPST